MASAGLLAAVIVGLLIGVVVFEDSLGRAALTAGGIGVGVAIGTYMFTSQLR
jgi:hypothetical protein